MSAAIRTVETEKGPISYDSDMPMSVLRLMLGVEEGDLEGLVTAMTQVVTEWPFEGDPGDPEAWWSLRRTEFNTTVKSVTGDLASVGEE